ncbi:SPFH domain-containing protein [Sorangium sp. So ce375]|uniref:prohibitin family protein n=1 Tax=Sorangium sp. So ce375 TaxID=3133306 RepID=UPI003F5BB242
MAKIPSIKFGRSGGGAGAARGIALGLLLVLAMLFVACTTVTRIDAAHVGIRVKLAGSNRGVDDIPVVTGWVFYNPLTEQIVQFPTSVQNVVWTASSHEGRTVDESITFSSSEGVNVGADIGMSFHIEPDKAPHLYLRFRENDLMRLADRYVRNAVREAFNSVASTMPVQEIYGSGKTKLIHDVVKELELVLSKDGIRIDQLTINGALRLPENVAAAINQAMEATQKSIQAENRVRQVRAEADQAIATARGAAESARERARGEADALLIRARAEAKANTIIRLSTTPAVLQYRALERWNGRLPAMNQGPLPMLTFDMKSALDKDAEQKLAALLEETAPGGDAATSGGAAPAPGAAPGGGAAPGAGGDDGGKGAKPAEKPAGQAPAGAP